MGINRLFPFLFLEHVFIEDLHPKSVAIDMSCFIHKAKYANCSALAIDETGKDFLESLERYFLHFIAIGNCKIYMVFDGEVPDYKKEEHESRRMDFEDKKKKAKIMMSSTSLEERDKGKLLLVQTIETRTLTELIKKYFSKHESIVFVDADYEADTCLAQLSLFGSAEYLITEDSDLIVYGCSKIIFKLDSKGEAKLYRRETCYISYDSKGFYVKISINDFDNLVEFCVMCGCDYFEGFVGIGPVTALKICLSTKRLENYLETIKLKDIDRFLKFERAVNVFRRINNELIKS